MAALIVSLPATPLIVRRADLTSPAPWLAMRDAIDCLEDIVVGSVALTARALAAAAPDLTLLQWRAIVVIGEAQGGLTVGDLAARIGATSSATSRLIGRLVQRGVVATTKEGDDRRATWVVLTPTGDDLRVRVTERRALDLETIAASPAVQAGDGLARLAAEFRRLR